MLDAVIFDLGNTLMYFAGDWPTVTEQGLDAMVRYLRQNGIDVGADFGHAFATRRREGRELSIRTDVEYTATQALRDTLAALGYKEIPEPLLCRALELFFEPEEEYWVPYPDARATLAALRARDLKVGLISNATDDDMIRRIVRRAGLYSLIDPVITSAGVPWRKPDPQIFRYVLDGWQVEPRRAVMVGDWPSMDVLGAHRAGMRAILLENRWEQPPTVHVDIPDPELLQPDAVVLELSEILPVIERLDGSQNNQ